MKLLLIHSDFIEFEVKDKTKVAEEVSEEGKSGRAEEALVAFTAVEKDDENDPDLIIEKAFEEILDVQGKVNAEKVVVYPYAHLSQSLSSPETAVKVLEGIKGRLEEEGLDVLKAPFGWYKSFSISCKGHPLSELSREITAEPVEEEEKEVKSEWMIIDEEGEEHAPLDFSGSKEFRKIIDYEVRDTVDKGEEPPHINLMKEKELVGYDKLSDPGNLRWYPNGKLVRDLLIDYVNDITIEYGAVNVETPVMYDLGDKAISEHSSKFGERQYRFSSGNREMLLRFAACFGMFSMMNEMFLTDDNLPLKMYELSTYSFRREQKGELMGLRRQRAFTMPDMHTACNDLDEARKEFGEQVKWTLKTEDDLGLSYHIIFRATKDFYDENEKWIRGLIGDIGRPALVEVIDERKHYWVAKFDLAALDALGRPLENPTVQIDVESADRFGITVYKDEDKIRPPILHTSPTGSIERVLCAILENISQEDKPQFPLWLSPTQVRIIPIGDEHLENVQEIVDKISSNRIRVDIDDRDRTVGKRIRRAEKDWVPYTIVFGDREIGSEKVPVRVREKGEEIDMTIEDLISEMNEKVSGKPFKPLSLSKLISNRPSFSR